MKKRIFTLLLVVCVFSLLMCINVFAIEQNDLLLNDENDEFVPIAIEPELPTIEPEIEIDDEEVPQAETPMADSAAQVTRDGDTVVIAVVVGLSLAGIVYVAVFQKKQKEDSNKKRKTSGD